MKTVTVEQFRAEVDKYLTEAADGEVVLTRDGEPWLVLHGMAGNGGVDSEAFARSETFRRMIQERRQEQGIPWEEAKKQLNLDT